jgi:hypothetical protein
MTNKIAEKAGALRRYSAERNQDQHFTDTVQRDKMRRVINVHQAFRGPTHDADE